MAPNLNTPEYIPAILMDYQEMRWKLLCLVIKLIKIAAQMLRILYTLFITVPLESSSVSEAFFRFSTFSLTQVFGDQVIVSNCIESLETLVRRTTYPLDLQILCCLLI